MTAPPAGGPPGPGSSRGGPPVPAVPSGPPSSSADGASARKSSLPPAPEVNFRLELPLQPEWQNVDLLRLAILNCLSAVFGDPELSESVGIVTSELLENAIKYGDWSRAACRTLLLHVRGVGSEVRVEVASPLHEGSKHLERLRETIAWIHGFPSPRDAYIARMRAIAEQQEKTGESKMGLVRIAYEGPCAIGAADEGDGLLRVRASIPTVGRGAES